MVHAQTRASELHEEIPRRVERRFDEAEEIWSRLIKTAQGFQRKQPEKEASE
jgi:hypothetical protein